MTFNKTVVQIVSSVDFDVLTCADGIDNGLWSRRNNVLKMKTLNFLVKFSTSRGIDNFVGSWDGILERRLDLGVLR